MTPWAFWLQSLCIILYYFAFRELNPCTFPEYSYLREGKKHLLSPQLLLSSGQTSFPSYLLQTIMGQSSAYGGQFLMQEYEASCSPVQWEFTSLCEDKFTLPALCSASLHQNYQ